MEIKGKDSPLVSKLMAANEYGNKMAEHNKRLIEFTELMPCTCVPNGTFNKCPRCRTLVSI